jgi:hypothetical protein
VIKISIVSALLVSAQSLTPIEAAMAETSKGVHSSHHPTTKHQEAVGLETIEPKEDKERKQGDWNGSYVGVNAGAGFGATAGTNVVIPLGSSAGK